MTFSLLSLVMASSVWLAAFAEGEILQHLDNVVMTLRENASAHIHAGMEVIGIIDELRISALRAAAPFTLERVVRQHTETMTEGESHRAN